MDLSRSQRGLEIAFLKGGAPPEALETLQWAFTESGELEKAAEKFARERVEARLQPVFTEIERLEIEVDLSIEPEEILRRGGQNPKHWEFRGSRPESSSKMKVLVVIGTFNKGMTREQMLSYLADAPEHASMMDLPYLNGSGAWVREAYLAARPDYDGKGAMAFPDNGSRWRDLLGKHGKDERDCMPGIWHDDGRMGARSLDDVGDVMRKERRVAFILE